MFWLRNTKLFFCYTLLTKVLDLLKKANSSDYRTTLVLLVHMLKMTTAGSISCKNEKCYAIEKLNSKLPENWDL